ncbi:DUF421 domain-containing protein [Entomobacter blattae]|uniref:DUF421 domain-containing protein n=1 Tax=Entomobacter blattae TaxID=2762277 RepID=A0A7H1NT04_9PROT|nr:YetF domain-containing protein [Entomobacter blattae]QNT78914.1 hypothetical protein JGUZn3_16960 [Entomobacter blattae]
MPSTYILVRLIIDMVCMTIYMRLYGRKFMSMVNPIDLINMMVIGAIIGGIIYNPNVHPLSMIMALLLWGGLNHLFEYLRQKNPLLQSLTQGEYIRLITKGRIVQDGLSRSGLTLGSLRIQLRMKGIFSLMEVEHAQIEINGQITVKTTGISYFSTMLINEGQIELNGIREINRSREWLEKLISCQGYTEIKDIFYAEWIENQGLYIINHVGSTNMVVLPNNLAA